MRTRFIQLTGLDGIIHIIDTTIISEFVQEGSKESGGVRVVWKDTMRSATRFQESIQKVNRTLEL